MKELLSNYQNRLEKILTRYIDNLNAPSILLESIKYSSLNAGKRLRPAIVYAVGEALNTPLEKLDSAAMALELMHCYSLVHDDLPAMDDDALRRGKPSCHIQFDEATAILTGDAQQSLAIEAISNCSMISDRKKILQIQIISKYSGAEEMIAGQILDMTVENTEIPLKQLRTIHELKTASMLTAALLLGASCDDGYEQLQPTLKQLGKNIGLAFQIHDDILDIESDTKTLGKIQGSDIEARKITYPKLLGLVEAKNYRDKMIDNAQDILKSLPFESTFLLELIHYITTRKY